ncbi:MAG: phosphate ABC transporter substrate-binding protein PstS family protein [Lachnospiraceae bacterium]|nr:phosphate ABC transporter substrate-binding protein PstS family protein [Lachnospiraceae bacterium]
MMNKFRKVVAVACVAGLALTGCGNENANSTSTKGTESDTTKKLSGTISLAGSTSMEKLANALQEAFMEENPGVTVEVEYSGSSAGVESLISGSVDIGNSSRALKDSEKESGAVENIVAIDGIAVIVDKNNTVVDLTKDELISIYTGAATNWSELGGADQPIVVVGREAGSGTRGAFEELLGIEDACTYANELSSTGAVMATVAATPGAIGYVSLDVIDDSVIAVALNGVAATVENIKGGSYFLSRPFVMATKGAISEQSELVQAWFGFIQSDAGKSIVEQVGLIVND